MGIQNTKELQNYIIGEEVTEEKAEYIKKLIGAFSEYLVAVNSDYVYNKTYMSAFVDDFILCQKALKKKRQILLNQIIAKLIVSEIDVNNVTVCIDDVWRYKNRKLELTNVINPYYVKRNKMQIELEYIGDNGFVVAEELDINVDCDEKLENCISVFMERWEEMLDEEI